MSKPYINQIMKKLKCSAKKKKEIRRQLEAEISEFGTDAGMPELVARLGKPSEIAEEFNQSFPEQEKKKYKKEKYAKIAGCIAAVLILCALFVFWALPKTYSLENSSIFSEKDVIEQAETVITLLDAKEYEALAAASDPVMEDYLREDMIEAAKAQVCSEWGERVSIGNTYTAGVSQMGKKGAVVEMHVDYENVSVLYTLSFNEDMKLQGLFIK